MAIQPSDIHLRYTVAVGTQGNSNAQTVPNASLGPWMSTTDWLGNTLSDLFDTLTGPENAALRADYRAIAVYNTNGTDAWLGASVYISAFTPGGSTISIGVDPAAASVANSSVPQGASIPNTTTAPAGVVFSTPLTPGAPVLLGDIPAGFCRILWLKRQASNTAPLTPASVTLSFSGGTNA